MKPRSITNRAHAYARAYLKRTDEVALTELTPAQRLLIFAAARRGWEHGFRRALKEVRARMHPDPPEYDPYVNDNLGSWLNDIR